ncbi:CRISPR-associated endonuclease Cas2 [Ferrovibrio sp.]|uniref:CRISPR-associated endonuclease Cas2 n=1 Tax=Ferrovibrio sp. TaxID=1917215 RepID=UPI0025BA3418|nr:CRISPR-associated endonuclease Cas2 [Ferrovibrio sp.]
MSGNTTQFTILSGYRLMWMMALFDLPVDDSQRRRAATDFRNELLDMGFQMTQFSVYMKHLTGKEQAESLTRRIASAVPEYGDVKILCFTDKQYENLVSFRGRKRDTAPQNPGQLALF